MDNQFDDLEVKAPELSFDIPVSTDLPAAAPVQTPEVKVPQEDLNLTEEEMRQVAETMKQLAIEHYRWQTIAEQYYTNFREDLNKQ